MCSTVQSDSNPAPSAAFAISIAPAPEVNVMVLAKAIPNFILASCPTMQPPPASARLDPRPISRKSFVMKRRQLVDFIETVGQL
jgi:hypothetical protein